MAAPGGLPRTETRYGVVRRRHSRLVPAGREVHASGKRHSRDELAAKCEARHEARADDAKRRERNAKLIPYPEKIRNRMGAHGISADKVAAEMKRDYNPPPAHLVRSQDGWTVWSVIQVYSEQLNWPGVE
jgi:hypothetical protein